MLMTAKICLLTACRTHSPLITILQLLMRNFIWHDRSRFTCKETNVWHFRRLAYLMTDEFWWVLNKSTCKKKSSLNNLGIIKATLLAISFTGVVIVMEYKKLLYAFIVFNYRVVPLRPPVVKLLNNTFPSASEWREWRSATSIHPPGGSSIHQSSQGPQQI